MFFGDYKSHAIPFFISSNLLPLDLLYFKSVAILMHDVFNNLSPPEITNTFNFQSNIHPYNRQDLRQEVTSSCNTLDWKNKVSPYYGSVLKSGIAYLHVEKRHTSKANFKRKIHYLLLQKFSEADDYIDLPDLIKN